MLRRGTSSRANAQQYSDMEKSLDDLLSYQLVNVVPVLDESGREVVINAGSYGRILKVLVNGALCAAKEIHYNIVAGPDNLYVRQFIRECELISQMRHPNVVQFLGIHQPERPNNFTDQLPLPWLVMEFVPSDLHSFLERLIEIPFTVRVAILLDIVQGLSYLHNNPSLEEIIHRDLSARNVLLTASLTAKLADFGVSKQRAYDATMTRDTGNPLYMPPENKAGSVARYNSKMDIFSFGVIMLFTIVKKFPQSLETETYTHPTRGLLARSEIERRQKYFDEVEGSTDQTVRTLVTLCKSCLENMPERRPRADDLVHRIRELNTGDELMAMDKMQLMVRVRELETRRPSLSRQASRQSVGTTEDVATLQTEVEDLRQQLDAREAELQTVQDDLRQLRRQHSDAESELRRLHERAGQMQGLQTALTESRAEKERLRTQLEYREQELVRKQHALDREKEITDNYQRIIDMGQSEVATDQDELQRAQMGLLQAQTERDELRRVHDDLSGQLRAKEEDMERLNEAFKKKEDECKRATKKAIEYKDQLDSRPQAPSLPVRGYEPSIPILPPSGLKTTLSLSSPTRQDPSPHGLHSAHGVRYRNQVLFGGAVQAADSNHKRVILGYDLDLHKWSEFSWHPRRYMHFAMAVVNGRLLLVGGYIDARNEYSDEVFEFDPSRGWKECCRLPNKIAKAAAFSYRNWLIVAGGTTTSAKLVEQVHALEIGTRTSWKSLKPIPEPIQDLQIATFVYCHHSDPNKDVAVVYLTACRQGLTPRQPTMAVSIPHLIHSGAQWMKIPDPPVKSPGVITMRGHLLAVGGLEAKKTNSLSNKVYMYHHGTREWLAVSDIANPRQKCTCVGLSDTKFMVLGGRDKRTEYSMEVQVFSLPTPNAPR